VGLIELINNTISKNMAFVPSAILSNNQKFNKTVVNYDSDFFKSDDGNFLMLSKNDTTTF
jgi:hypothetical protein